MIYEELDPHAVLDAIHWFKPSPEQLQTIYVVCGIKTRKQSGVSVEEMAYALQYHDKEIVDFESGEGKWDHELYREWFAVCRHAEFLSTKKPATT